VSGRFTQNRFQRDPVEHGLAGKPSLGHGRSDMFSNQGKSTAHVLVEEKADAGV